MRNKLPRQKHVECVFNVWVDLEKKAVLDTGVEVSTKYVRQVRAKGSYENQEKHFTGVPEEQIYFQTGTKTTFGRQSHHSSKFLPMSHPLPGLKVHNM